MNNKKYTQCSLVSVIPSNTVATIFIVNNTLAYMSPTCTVTFFDKNRWGKWITLCSYFWILYDWSFANQHIITSTLRSIKLNFESCLIYSCNIEWGASNLTIWTEAFWCINKLNIWSTVRVWGIYYGVTNFWFFSSILFKSYFIRVCSCSCSIKIYSLPLFFSNL